VLHLKILIAILLFSILIIFHELGHFLTAKLCGIRVREFTLGLGPTLFGITKGETKYCLKLLPFGGSCVMGEDEESEEPDAFNNKPVWARIAVVAAGPVFNFLLAFFFALILIACVGYDEPVVQAVTEGFPAEEAGIQPGDEILKLNNDRIRVYREISLYVNMHQGETVRVTYERDGEVYEATLEPKLDEESGNYYLGFLSNGARTKGNLFQVLKYSVREVEYWIETTYKSLAMIFKGKVKADDVSGPVGIVSAIGDTYEESKADGAYYVLLNMLNFGILLSANLGVMNLLPLPALDGGRLVFLLLEVLRRKPIDREKEGMVHFVGFALLMALMVFVLFNDIRKLF
jgi:regulator of sigma E protease